MSFQVKLSGHKDVESNEDQQAFLDKVETAAAAAVAAFKESLGDDAQSLYTAEMISDRGSTNLLAPKAEAAAPKEAASTAVADALAEDTEKSGTAGTDGTAKADKGSATP